MSPAHRAVAPSVPLRPGGGAGCDGGGCDGDGWEGGKGRQASPRARERTPLLAELLPFLVLTTIEHAVAGVPAHVNQSSQVMLVSHSRLRCCSQCAESVRTAGPFADAFQSKHMWLRQSVGMGAHALQQVRRNANDREKSILQTNHVHQYGRVRTSAAHTDANELRKARSRQSNGESG
jgi:hypothetical protein